MSLTESEVNWIRNKHVEDVDTPVQTVPQLLRSHFETLVQYQQQVKITKTTANAMARATLVRVAQLTRLLKKNANDAKCRHTLAKALRDGCRMVLSIRDALQVTQEFDLENGLDLKDDLCEDKDLSFFPVFVGLEDTPVAEVPASEYRIRVFPQPEKEATEASTVPVYTQLVLFHDAIRENLGVLVFRAPNTLITKVGEDQWLGLCQSSCSLLLDHISKGSDLVRAAEGTTKDFGAKWVWVYAEADTYRPGAKWVRESNRTALVVPKDGALFLQRSHLQWVFGIQKDPVR